MKSSLRIIYSLIVFVIGIVLLSVLTVLLIYENRQTHLSFDQVNQSHEARQRAEQFLSDFKEADYMTSRNSTDPVFASNYVLLLKGHLQKLDSLSQNNSENKRIIHRLDSLTEIQGKIWDTRSTRQDKPNDEAIADVTALVRKLQSIHLNELNERHQFAKRHSLLPALIGVGLSTFSILIFILAFYFTNSELKRTNHLNNELESKNLQLEKYTKELSTFTDITSHDMQEPLRKIEMYISIIEDREKQSLSPKAVQHFAKIKESVNRMRNLFYSILSFNLADQTRHIRSDVDLNEVLKETLTSLQTYVGDTNAMISSEPLPVVKGVRHQLVQLFGNIISNGLKFKRPEVVPEIRIAYEIVEGKDFDLRDLRKDARYYKINFYDNGIGFDQKYDDKIFEIFQRHVRTDTNSVGIGLSICRKIAHNHDGAMTASSEINKGSLFSFFIPV